MKLEQAELKLKVGCAVAALSPLLLALLTIAVHFVVEFISFVWRHT